MNNSSDTREGWENEEYFVFKSYLHHSWNEKVLFESSQYGLPSQMVAFTTCDLASKNFRGKMDLIAPQTVTYL